MGDHRASIKIEMEFHGVKDKTDMWVNYSPSDCFSMDQRVIEFFQSVYERGMAIYNRDMEDYYAKENKESIERAEREELERLKTKYEKKAQGGE